MPSSRGTVTLCLHKTVETHRTLRNKEGDCYRVTYSDMFTYSLVIIAIITLVVQITKK